MSDKWPPDAKNAKFTGEPDPGYRPCAAFEEERLAKSQEFAATIEEIRAQVEAQR